MWSPAHILVATDFSRAGDAAAYVGSAIARRTGASVELVHLIDDLAALADPAGVVARAEERLAALAKRAGIPEAVVKATYGNAAETLSEEHAGGASDLLVLGARGLRGLRRFVLGSVADRVLRRPGCPLLLVSRRPAGAELKRLLVTVELPDRATPALRVGLALAHSLRAEVTLVHVLPPRGYVSDARHVELDPDSVPARLARLIADTDPTVPVEISVQRGDPATAIPSLARELRADLVVLGAERRPDGWPGRVADAVARAGLPALLYAWPLVAEPGDGYFDADAKRRGSDMAGILDKLSEEVQDLKRMRDELRVQLDLGKMEARDRWEKAEKSWSNVEGKMKMVARETGEALNDVGEATKLLLEEIGEHYREIRKRL